MALTERFSNRVKKAWWESIQRTINGIDWVFMLAQAWTEFNSKKVGFDELYIS